MDWLGKIEDKETMKEMREAFHFFNGMALIGMFAIVHVVCLERTFF